MEKSQANSSEKRRYILKCLMTALITFFVLSFGCAAQTIDVQPVSSIHNLEYEKVINNPCLDIDVWVYIKHTDPWEPTCRVVVHVPKHSLSGDAQNCPAQDTKLVGQGRIGKSYAGYHVVTLKKGFLNDPKNFTTKPPRRIKIPANNFGIRHIGF